MILAPLLEAGKPQSQLLGHGSATGTLCAAKKKVLRYRAPRRFATASKRTDSADAHSPQE